MAIDGVNAIPREMPAANAVSQHSLTRGERELQVEEGQPPMEVAASEQADVRWQKQDALAEKWRRGMPRKRRKQALAKRALHEPEEDLQMEDDPDFSTEEELETGRNFDVRS